jgi:hypothetical protein
MSDAGGGRSKIDIGCCCKGALCNMRESVRQSRPWHDIASYHNSLAERDAQVEGSVEGERDQNRRNVTGLVLPLTILKDAQGR